MAERHRVSRSRLLPFFAERQPAVVLLEATGSAHYWGRQLRELGHQPGLLPPRAVQRYRDGNKTDRTDAKAMLEASRNEAIRPVPIKTVAQQAVTSLHRLRSAWMATRTARINTVRGLLRELGVPIPVGSTKGAPAVIALLADPRVRCLPRCDQRFSMRARRLPSSSDGSRVRSDSSRLSVRRSPPPAISDRFPASVFSPPPLWPPCRRCAPFPTARHFASYLGLTPRERSSGEQRRLGHISKRGDTYLRCLLTHGARAVLRAAHLKSSPSRLHAWALEVEQRRGHNIAAIALANKLARIAWALWRQERSFA